MSQWVVSNFFTSLATLSLGVFVFLFNRKSEINRIFCFYSLSISVWSFFTAFHAFTSSKSLSLLSAKIMHLGVLLIPILFFHFCLVILDSYKKYKNKLFVGYLVSFVLIMLNFSTNLIVLRVRPKLGYQYFMDGGILYPILILSFIIYTLFSLYLLLKGCFVSTENKKNQLKYLFSGSLLGYIFGVSCFLPVYDIIIFPYPIGSYAICAYVLITTYAVLKYRLMDIRIAFTRAGIFLVVYTIVLGIPFVVLQRTGSGLLATSLAVVVASAGPLIYRFLQVKAESVILAQQHRYQKILLRTAIGMVTEHDLKKLSRLIVYILKNTIRINFSAIFIRDKKNNSYHLEAIRGESNLGKYVESFSEKDPFIGYLKKNREYFFFEEAPEQIKSSSNILFKSKVVIPALIGDELLGFVFLGEKTNGQPYSIEDINVFKILSHQAALAIENCIFFEESKDAQQRMFAAEKLASIGGMADGLAHQIKNRLNLFSLAGGELKLEIKSFLEKHDPLIKSNPELDTTFKYLHELGTSIMDNVKRTDGIIKGILDFAKVEKKENFFTVFSFKETVELSSVLLMLKHEAASLPLNVKIDSQDTIYGVKSQLTEVIYNLLDNACEAIKEKKIQLNAKDLESFSPAIELSLAHTPDRQIIKISDNGMGIKEEDKLKIFAPFFTTKSSYKSGSGIGVYVVKRIIEENHKGKIRFSSTYMEGTSFTIELPKK